MALFGFGKKKNVPAPEPPKPVPASKPAPAPDPDSPEALYRKGMDLRDLGRYSAAFPTLLLASGKGHGEAMLECARMYQRGEGIGKNLKLALGLAEKAEALGVSGASGAKAEIAAQFLLEDGGRPAAKAPAAPAPSPAKPAPKPEPPKPAPSPVQAPVKPAPAPAAQSGPQPGEEDYQRGNELRRAKDFDGAAAAWTKAAELGHPEALKKLTGFYAGDWLTWALRGKDKEIIANYVDHDKAIQWGTAAMDQGVDTASIIMGIYEKKGQLEKAIDFGEKAAGRGFDAEWKLMYLCIEAGRYEDAIAWGRKYDEKKGTDEAKKRIEQIRDEAFNKGVAAHKEKDHPHALSLFEKSAGLGSSAAMFSCGLMHYNGEGMAVDKAKALMWFEKAAQQGMALAQFKCGLMYSQGEGTATDQAKALVWFEKAAEQGHADAQFKCGACYAVGLGTAIDKAKGRMWYERAAEQGHISAQYCCGLTYSDGASTAADKAKALMWVEKAAEQGYTDAQFKCGMMYYFEGEGPVLDKAKALMWFKKATEQGHSLAQTLLNKCAQLFWNDGLAAYQTKDFTKALSIFEKIAELGFAAAQFNCGKMYYYGEGTTADKAKAKMWFEKAAAQTEDKETQEQAKELLRKHF